MKRRFYGKHGRLPYTEDEREHRFVTDLIAGVLGAAVIGMPAWFILLGI